MAITIKARKLIEVSIIVFWILMMGLLFSREIVSNHRISAYRPFLSKNTLLSDQWLGIYFNNSPVGFVHTSIEPHIIEKGISGYRVTNRTLMNFLLLRKRNKVWFNAEAIVDDDYQLVKFHFELNSGLHKMTVKGYVSDKKIMELEINSQGEISKRKILLPKKEGVIIASIISPFNSFGELKVGAKYALKVFNPFSLELEALDIEVTHKEMFERQGLSQEAFVVKSEYRGLIQTAWINDKGEILKEETPMGWVLLKEDADTASHTYSTIMSNDTELEDLVSLSSNVVLASSDLNYLKIKLTGIEDGFSLLSQRQKIIGEDSGQNSKIIEIVKENPDLLPALTIPIDAQKEFQAESDFIQINNSQIKAQARQIIKDEKDSFAAAKKINQWVFENIRKVPVVSIPSAIDVFKTKEGDCNEHAVLFAALARCVGIPTKINVGLAYSQGRFYYHAWCSVYVGQWVDIDPTFGEDIANPAHIKLIEGDLNKQLDVVRLIGKIKLEVIDYK